MSQIIIKDDFLFICQLNGRLLQPAEEQHGRAQANEEAKGQEGEPRLENHPHPMIDDAGGLSLAQIIANLAESDIFIHFFFYLYSQTKVLACINSN